VIEMRRKQLGFGDGLIAEEVSDLREDWMKHADEVLADEEIVAIVYEALAVDGCRRPRLFGGIAQWTAYCSGRTMPV
jgi:hypothetical protein